MRQSGKGPGGICLGMVTTEGFMRISSFLLLALGASRYHKQKTTAAPTEGCAPSKVTHLSPTHCINENGLELVWADPSLYTANKF